MTKKRRLILSFLKCANTDHSSFRSQLPRSIVNILPSCSMRGLDEIVIKKTFFIIKLSLSSSFREFDHRTYATVLLDSASWYRKMIIRLTISAL